MVKRKYLIASVIIAMALLGSWLFVQSRTYASPTLERGVQTITILESFSEGVFADANRYPAFYFNFLPVGQLQNVTGVYCNIIYYSNNWAEWSHKLIIDINGDLDWWEQDYSIVDLEPLCDKPRTKIFNMTDSGASDIIRTGVNLIEFIDWDAGALEYTYINRVELLIEYNYFR